MEKISEEYQRRIEHEFNALCKIIIHHSSAEAKGKASKRWKQEISFEYLVESGVIPAYSCGGFENGIEARYPLLLCGHTVILENERLSKALSSLEREKQEIVFLYFLNIILTRKLQGIMVRHIVAFGAGCRR